LDSFDIQLSVVIQNSGKSNEIRRDGDDKTTFVYYRLADRPPCSGGAVHVQSGQAISRSKMVTLAFASPVSVAPQRARPLLIRRASCHQSSLSVNVRVSFKHAYNTKRVKAALDALLFDCDGVLALTEEDGHRVAFNRAFKEKGIIDSWGVSLYGELLSVGGGKERMSAYWASVGWPSGYEADTGAQQALVKELHSRKTEIFMDMVASSKIPLRSGVARLIEEAFAAGTTVAVCSTSNERAVAAIVGQLGADRARAIRIFAGDVVKAKKPDPAIYILAATELGLHPSRVCVIEDSYIGLTAAKAANMRCLVTTNSYTQGEDFAAADRIVESLDSPRVRLSDLEDLVQE
jgi:HAD superfamily hydrolase (TIGR01509 family)